VIGSFVPIPVVGTVAGAVGGLIVGVAFSAGLDRVYDELPKNVTDSIEGGLDRVGNTIGDAGGAIKDAWNSIF
jgi:hypothetical protein